MNMYVTLARRVNQVRMKADGELRMSWLAFVNLSPEAVVKLANNGAAYRARTVELHPQGKGFRSYRSFRTGKRVKAVAVK